MSKAKLTPEQRDERGSSPDNFTIVPLDDEDEPEVGKMTPAERADRWSNPDNFIFTPLNEAEG